MSDRETPQYLILLEQRLRRLERRVKELEEAAGGAPAARVDEQSLGIDGPLAVAGDGVPPASKAPIPAIPVDSSSPPFDPEFPAPPTMDAPRPGVPIEGLLAAGFEAAKRHVHVPRDPVPPVIVIDPLAYQPSPTPQRRKESHSNVEQLIGLNWTGWIGAIVLVIGAALGIKFAYDQGWLGGLPKEVRLGFCFAVGLALLGVGQWIDRKINRVSAACVFGAGIATLFVVSYAGFGYFELYAQSTAFVLMATSTFIGAGVAMRKNLVSIAMLSLLGGNLAPIILKSHDPKYGSLLGYILTLQMIALVLAAWGRVNKWWILRGLAVVMPAVWIGELYSLNVDVTLLMIFSGVYAALAQAEFIFSSHEAIEGDALFAAASICVTAMLTISLEYGLQARASVTRGEAILALAAISGVLGVLLRSKRKELATCFRVQAAILVLVSVPVLLDGPAVMLAWSGLSLAYAIAGRTLRSKWGPWFGGAAWMGAAAYLGQWLGNHNAEANRIVLQVPVYWLLATGTAVIGHVLAWIVSLPMTANSHGVGSALADRSAGESAGQKNGPPRRTLPDEEIVTLAQVIDVAAAGMIGAATLAAFVPWMATGFLVVYAWLLVAIGRLLHRATWSALSAAAMAFTLAKWIAVDVVAARSQPVYVGKSWMPLINPEMGNGVLLAGSIMGMYAVQRAAFNDWLARRHVGSPLVAVAAVVVAILTLALSLEVDRAVQQRASLASAWRPMQLEMFGFTLLWTAALGVMAEIINRLAEPGQNRQRWLVGCGAILSLVAIQFIVVDVFIGTALCGPASVTPIANLQILTAAVVCLGLWLYAWLREQAGRPSRSAGWLMLAIALICGTTEIDRAFHVTSLVSWFASDAHLAEQVAISIYWSLFAVGSIIGGFAIRRSKLRYFGLALLAVSLAKVVFYDLQELSSGYRILSFLALGGLLLATSVVYGMLSPKLLERRTTDA